MRQRAGVTDGSKHRGTEDVAEEMRGQQIATFAEVQWGMLESSGTISFIKKSGSS